MNLLYKHLEEFIRVAEKTFSFGKLFDNLGVSAILDELYIAPQDLTEEYIDIFYKEIKAFKNQTLYRELSFSDKSDLKVIRDDDIFKLKIEETITKIKKELDSRSTRVMKEISKYGSSKEISLEDLRKAVKLDKASLLFILDDLKDEGVIYDYNGREITTK